MNSIFTSMKKVAALALAGAVVVALAACGAKTTQPDTTNLRLINLAPENGALNLVLGDDPGTSLATGVAFRASSGYKSFESGAVRLRVNGTSGTLIDTKIVLAGKANTTLLMYGGSATISSAIIGDVESISTTAANFKIRFGNYGVGLPTMDLYMLKSTENLTDAQPLVRGVTTRAVTDFSDLAAAGLSIKLTETGTKDLIFDSDAYTFVAGKTYFLTAYSNGSGRLANTILQEFNTDGSITLLNNKIARVRALNGSNDSGPIVLRGGASGNEILFSSIPYEGASGYKIVPVGAVNLRFELANTPGTTTAASAVTFNGGMDYTAVLAGSVLANSARATAYIDQSFPPAPSKARVRFVNATSGVGIVDAYASFAPVVKGLAQNAASSYIELNAGTVDYTVNGAGQGASILSIPPVTVTAGLVYTVFIIGQPGFLKGVVRQDN